MPAADEAGDADFALKLHMMLNEVTRPEARQEPSQSLAESDAAIAWRMQQELDREQGSLVVLSSDSDDEGVDRMCVVCNSRPADKSSLRFSSRPTWCCKHCAREQETATVIMSCTICTEEMRGIEFAQLQCSHSFCRACMQRHVAAQLENGSYPIRCIDSAEVRKMKCGNEYDAHRCPSGDCEEPLTSRETFTFITTDKEHLLFSQMEVVAGIPLADRVYCPKQSCSTLFVVPDDKDGTADGSAVCTACKFVFCVRCRTEWHGGVTCEEHKNNLEDAPVLKLAAQENWRACPHCKQMVSKKEGCNTMTCRCGGKFCYTCGANRAGLCSHMHH